jgi:hypothetical protein
MVKAYKLPIFGEQKTLLEIEDISRVFLQVICRKFLQVFGKRGMTYELGIPAALPSV